MECQSGNHEKCAFNNESGSGRADWNKVMDRCVRCVCVWMERRRRLRQMPDCLLLMSGSGDLLLCSKTYAHTQTVTCISLTDWIGMCVWFHLLLGFSSDTVSLLNQDPGFERKKETGRGKRSSISHMVCQALSLLSHTHGAGLIAGQGIRNMDLQSNWVILCDRWRCCRWMECTVCQSLRKVKEQWDRMLQSVRAGRREDQNSSCVTGSRSSGWEQREKNTTVRIRKTGSCSFTALLCSALPLPSSLRSRPAPPIIAITAKQRCDSSMRTKQHHESHSLAVVLLRSPKKFRLSMPGNACRRIGSWEQNLRGKGKGISCGTSLCYYYSAHPLCVLVNDCKPTHFLLPSNAWRRDCSGSSMRGCFFYSKKKKSYSPLDPCHGCCTLTGIRDDDGSGRPERGECTSEWERSKKKKEDGNDRKLQPVMERRGWREERRGKRRRNHCSRP